MISAHVSKVDHDMRNRCAHKEQPDLSNVYVLGGALRPKQHV